MNQQVKIGQGSKIARGAVVVGEVELHENVGVWYNAVIRGDGGRITIGDNTNIQDNCTVHSDRGSDITIGCGVTLGHNVVFHGRSIGDHTLIGMGSIILSGAVIGANCLIGAGALVTGRANIPDGSLVYGNPAKIIRPLTETEIASNYDNAQEYVELLAQL